MSPVVRVALPEDAQALSEIYAPNVSDTVVSFELVAPEPVEMARRLMETVEEYPWLVCEGGSGVIGYAYAGRHRQRSAYQWAVDVSVYTHSDWRRRGVARGLYASLFSVLRMQGYFNAYAGIALPNSGSVAAHEAVGFRPVGVYREVGYKLGAWRDVGWWQLRLQPLIDDPPPPTPFREVRKAVEFPEALAAGSRLLAAG